MGENEDERSDEDEDREQKQETDRVIDAIVICLFFYLCGDSDLKTASQNTNNHGNSLLNQIGLNKSCELSPSRFMQSVYSGPHYVARSRTHTHIHIP